MVYSSETSSSNLLVAYIQAVAYYSSAVVNYVSEAVNINNTTWRLLEHYLYVH